MMEDIRVIPAQRRANADLAFPIAAFTALAMIVLLYRGTFFWWWYEWTVPGSFYAHALFVPFFVAAMIWRDREKLGQAVYDPSWTGVAYLVPAGLLLLLGLKADVTTITSISFMLLILGICTMLVGKTRTRMLMFPLLFIMLMMPLIPDQLINPIAFPIQLLSAKIATILLNAMTLHSKSVGTLIQMDSYKLAVELPCSGFKTLVSLLTFTAAFAYLTDAAKWKRWTLFLTTIPLSLLINALRITFIGIVGELVSSKAAASFHDYSGFIVLIMAFTFLFYFARVLRCERFLGMSLEDPPAKQSEPAVDAGAETKTEEPAAPETPWWTPLKGLQPTRMHLQQALPFVIAIDIFLLGTMGVQAVVVRPVVAQPPIGRAQVPMRFQAPGRNGGPAVTYTAVDDAANDKLTKNILEVLSPTRVISRTYVGSDGSAIDLFITAGNGRKVFHDPNTCMLGVGSSMRDIGQIPIHTKAGTVTVLETRFTRADLPDETEMLICYVVDGQMMPHTEDVRNRIMLQTLFGDGGKPSYCFRVTQKNSGSDAVRREQIVNFVNGIWGEIGPILTGNAPGDRNDGPPVSIAEDETARP